MTGFAGDVFGAGDRAGAAFVRNGFVVRGRGGGGLGGVGVGGSLCGDIVFGGGGGGRGGRADGVRVGRCGCRGHAVGGGHGGKVRCFDVVKTLSKGVSGCVRSGTNLGSRVRMGDDEGVFC